MRVVQGLHGFITLYRQTGGQSTHNLTGDAFLLVGQALFPEAPIQPQRHFAPEGCVFFFQRVNTTAKQGAVGVGGMAGGFYLARQHLGLSQQLVETLLAWRQLRGAEFECAQRHCAGRAAIGLRRWRGFVVREKTGLIRHRL